MTLPFGEGERAEVFKHSLFLVSCNRLVAAAIAAATLLVRAIPGGGRSRRAQPFCLLLSGNPKRPP